MGGGGLDFTVVTELGPVCYVHGVEDVLVELALEVERMLPCYPPPLCIQPLPPLFEPLYLHLEIILLESYLLPSRE